VIEVPISRSTLVTLRPPKEEGRRRIHVFHKTKIPISNDKKPDSVLIISFQKCRTLNCIYFKTDLRTRRSHNRRLASMASGGKRIVFTGGSGKAGRHVIPELIKRGHKVITEVPSTSRVQH